MTKWKLLLFCGVVLLFSLFGCSIAKKTKTITTTLTVIHVDTIIRIIKDTIKITNEVYLNDTAFIEIETAKARSYYNPIKNKIVLEITGKIFNIPVKINKTTTTKTNIIEKINKKKMPLYVYVFVAMILLFIYAYLTQKK